MDELKKLLEPCRISKREKEELNKYFKSREYPKEKSNQIRFYSGYNKIRKITRLGNLMKEKGLMKE